MSRPVLLRLCSVEETGADRAPAADLQRELEALRATAEQLALSLVNLRLREKLEARSPGAEE